MRRQVTGDDLLEIDLVEHVAQARPHRDPDRLEVLGGGFVTGGLGPDTANFGQGTFETAEDLADGDLRRRASELVTTLVAALARDDPGMVALDIFSSSLQRPATARLSDHPNSPPDPEP